MLGLLILAVPVASAAGLEAGAAKVDITPPLGGPMWGYAARHDAPSLGVLDPLYARALVLAARGKRMALVSLDLGRAPPRHVTAAIRKRVQTVGVDAIFLVASHTHHGPVLEVEDWPDPKKPYLRRLERQLGDLILAADKARRPGRLGIASKQVPLNRNRHSKLRDKPVDRELLVLRLEDEQGKVIAHAVNFAAHATMQPAALRKFSADWPGALAALVEKETGAPCLFLQGAAGDLSPNPGTAHGPEQFGQAVGREALTLAKTIRCTVLPKATLQLHEDDFTFASRLDLGNRAIKAVFASAFFPALVAFYEREYRAGVRPQARRRPCWTVASASWASPASSSAAMP